MLTLLVAGCSPRRQPQPPSAPADARVNSLGMSFRLVRSSVLFSVYETRVSEFQRFVEATQREWLPPEAEMGPDTPAVNVAWDDAVAFCAWLTTQERAANQ